MQVAFSTSSAGLRLSGSHDKLPVIVGFESKTTDWFVLRGSVTQSVLISTVKDERGYPAVGGVTTPANGTAGLEYDGEPNNTSVAVVYNY